MISSYFLHEIRSSNSGIGREFLLHYPFGGRELDVGLQLPLSSRSRGSETCVRFPNWRCTNCYLSFLRVSFWEHRTKRSNNSCTDKEGFRVFLISSRMSLDLLKEKIGFSGRVKFPSMTIRTDGTVWFSKALQFFSVDYRKNFLVLTERPDDKIYLLSHFR